MQAIWVAAEMRAGGAYAHSIPALEEIEKKEAKENDANSADSKNGA